MHQAFSIYHFLAVNWIAITALVLSLLKWAHTIFTRLFEAESLADEKSLTGPKRHWFILAYITGNPAAK